MLTSLLIQKTLRVPQSTGPSGDGSPVARQMDAVLVQVGFKASRDLLEHISRLEPGAAMDHAVTIVGAVRGLVGDHVTHNPYFKTFPAGVPDTVEFWMSCLRDALVGARTSTTGGVPSDAELMGALNSGWVNLLDLPTYGTVQHTYEEMLAAHDTLIPSVKDRVTVLHLGGTLDDEAHRLYLDLAASPTPLTEADLELLDKLAQRCVDGAQPTVIPVRESRAVINAARLAAGRELLVDTVTDVLRLACHVSDGDVTLQTTTRFRSFRRAERRTLMAALERVIADNPSKLGDVGQHRGPWKRLGERLHPHEYPTCPHAQDVFAVARGEKIARSLAGQVELAFAAGDVRRATEVLSKAPGMLLRQVDRLLRAADDVDQVVHAVETVVGRVSGRVLCSVIEHLGNRDVADDARVFVGRSRRAWVTPDTRPPLDEKAAGQIAVVLRDELDRRLPVHEHLVVDPAVLDLALPLSGKATADGFGVMPRGSTIPVEGELLRFFMYWRQASQRTDYDLSALLLDDQFQHVGQVSWTNYHHDNAYYSGDITHAENGATEFIDVPLNAVKARYVVPQVNIYSGEGFDEVAESTFGFMTRDRSQKGQPFEASTVRMRSEMRGTGRIALPIVFKRGADGWTATWLHLYGRGFSWGNRIEANRLSTALLARAIVNRDYLTIGHLVHLLRAKATRYTEYGENVQLTGPVTFIGITAPEGLPAGSTVYTLANLGNLIPQ